jgi:hypothetical protein
MSREEERVLNEFMAITSLSADRAQLYLSSHNFDPSAALDAFYRDQSAPPPPRQRQGFVNQLLGAIFPAHASTPQDAASSLLQSLQSRYDAVPPFVAGSFTDAAALARDQLKFLVIYIHSAMHQDTHRFCRCLPYDCSSRGPHLPSFSQRYTGEW